MCTKYRVKLISQKMEVKKSAYQTLCLIISIFNNQYYFVVGKFISNKSTNDIKKQLYFYAQQVTLYAIKNPTF